MKYPYRKSVFWGWRSICFVTMLLLGYGMSESFLIAFLISVLINGLFFLTGIKKSLDRYIELYDETVRFSNHRYGRSYGRGFCIRSVTFDVRYKDVFIIEAKKLPLIGIWSVSLKAMEKEYKIKILPYYADFKKLYINLCKKVKEHNPEAYIDKRLLQYIESNEN